MIAVTPLLHEIIPHGWTGILLLERDGTVSGCYNEHPGGTALLRERGGEFLNDPASLLALWLPAFRAVGIGWTLHLQGYGYLDSAYYREIEAPLDACWKLDAMIGDGGRTFAGMQLTRPRSARPFTSDDVHKLDRLRPWLAHALRKPPVAAPASKNDIFNSGGPPLLSCEMVFTPNGRLVFQTSATNMLLAILDGELWSLRDPPRGGCGVPAPVQKLLRRIMGTVGGVSRRPPRMQISNAYGIITLEAKWLMPPGAIPADVAKDPRNCLIAVTIELREHAIAHAARILRESGATPAQVKVGVHLAMGKAKQEIADDLGIKHTTVADLTRKLYQTLDVHNSTELGTRIWLG
jgi:DNA-binding CsgD family transcriptional regulator